MSPLTMVQLYIIMIEIVLLGLTYVVQNAPPMETNDDRLYASMARNAPVREWGDDSYGHIVRTNNTVGRRSRETPQGSQIPDR